MTAIVSPPTIDAMPPAPQPTDTPSEFDTKSYATIVALATLITQLTAAGANVFQNATAANERAVSADGSATAASGYATAADAARDEAVSTVGEMDLLIQHFLGAAPADPTVGNEGAPLAAADWYINTGTGYIRAYNGTAWTQSIAASGGVESLNGQTGVVQLPRPIAYADRANLRANETWAHALVDGLGWFQWVSGSSEPDDDESCFATANGRWLLQAVHWDVIDSWQLPDDSARDEQDEDIAARWPGRVLRGTAVCAVTSVSSTASVAFTGTVLGAAAGDRVVVTPPAALGDTDTDSARLACHAYVSNVNEISVRLTNASAASATTNTAIRAAWPILVFKES